MGVDASASSGGGESGAEGTAATSGPDEAVVAVSGNCYNYTARDWDFEVYVPGAAPVSCDGEHTAVTIAVSPLSKDIPLPDQGRLTPKQQRQQVPPSVYLEQRVFCFNKVQEVLGTQAWVAFYPNTVFGTDPSTGKTVARCDLVSSREKGKLQPIPALSELEGAGAQRSWVLANATCATKTGKVVPCDSSAKKRFIFSHVALLNQSGREWPGVPSLLRMVKYACADVLTTEEYASFWPDRDNWKNGGRYGCAPTLAHWRTQGS